MHTITLPIDNDPLVADIYDAASIDAPTLLLLHGWGVSGRYWADTIARLRGDFRIIVPDLPGSGRSLPVRRARDMQAQVDAIVALLDHLKPDPVHVVGHSMGGGMAILLAAQQPDRVSRLVLTSIGVFRNERERRFFTIVTYFLALSMRLRFRFMADIGPLRRRMARRYFAAPPRDDALLYAWFRDYLLMDRPTAIASARSAPSRAIPDAARRITAPALLVVGDRDCDIPLANVEYTANAMPNAALRVIARSGHLPMVEQPDEFAAIVREFLMEQPSVAVELATSADV
jgi:pimeloyl-ACP methyl ester carboxylesterase